MLHQPSDPVTVVGGGVVGLATALELAARRVPVVVVDRGPIDGGCAIGSAGHLVPSHVVPLAEPGAVTAAVAGVMRRDGAVSVSWSASPAFWRWIWRFARSCTAESVASAAPALAALAALSAAVWDEWLAAAPQEVRPEGLLDVYRDRAAFARACRHADTLRRWGVDVEQLDGDEAVAMEPALRGPVAGAVHLVGDRSLDPARAMNRLVERAAAAGVTLLPSHEVIGIVTAGRRVVGLRTSRGDLTAGAVVIACGAWTGRFARLLGERVPVTAGRGLSLTVDAPATGPRRAMLLGEDHVAVAAMPGALRLSAWFQLNNFDTTVDPARIARLERIARRRLHLDDRLRAGRRWAGLRPVSPDGVPVIGRSRRWDNVTIAAGHSMTGLTNGPGTGRLVAQLVCGERPDIALDRFSPARFS